MKFGKEFRTHLENTLPEWREKFLCYKPLKIFVKSLPANHPDASLYFVEDHQPHIDIDADGDDGSTHIHDPSTHIHDPQRSRPWIGLEEWFVRILNEELEKFNDFYVDKEEDFVIRLQELKERIERVKEKSGKCGIFKTESEFSEEMLDIRKDFVSIHGEMVLLKNYSSLNFAGLVKILKKYDKRTGGLLRLPFTQRALHQPFFTTEPLTGLVRECEANLELLFPSEAEVIESTPRDRDQIDTPPTDTMIIPPESLTSIGEDTVDIYRSTLAAMRTIQGLRKASSTYNPLSFASFYRSQDDSSVGAVTAENSASNSPATTLQEETDQENAHSTE